MTPDPPQLEVLDAIQRRVLWLAVRMVDHANRERPNPSGVKVGGHQASSASMVSIMTALYVAHLDAVDRVAVKPHASPVLHALNYLMGRLDRRHLTRLRALGGLQAYPSRTKDPDPVDFSTGSVGLGPVATLFGALTREYVADHFGASREGRFVALIGDAELDEGNVWEALAEHAAQGLGNLLWIVDLNRQSLDRVVPGIKAAQLKRLFDSSGWHVVEAKYGRRLQEVFAGEDGAALRRHIDDMPNERYQSLFALDGDELRARFLEGADPAVGRVLDRVPEDEHAALLQNLGGHDLGELLRCLGEADADPTRPTVLFAYTVKGWGLPIAGDPLNHSALLSGDQVQELRESLGLTPDTEWDRFREGTAEAGACAAAARRLARDPSTGGTAIAVPATSGFRAGSKPLATQEAFGRIMTALARDERVADRLVTASPDVALSTNLGGWINRVGAYDRRGAPAGGAGDGGLLRWDESPKGQHIELGISEMNLFMLLGQLGLADAMSGERLLPVGTVYDVFVGRGLDALVYGLYGGGAFIVVGTPSGITLSAEGGAHQSTITPSIGLELPELVFAEPAFAEALDWLLCDGLARIARGGERRSTYLRLSTRPLDQAPFAAARERLGEAELRRQVLAGGYRLRDATGGRPTDRPVVQLVVSGALVPEVLAAADVLEDEGVAANVIDVTSLDRLHTAWVSSCRGAYQRARGAGEPHHLETLLPRDERDAPIVTVHDASSHAASWLGGVFGAPLVAVGVDGFGQSGALDEVYRAYGLTPGAVVNAALLALERAAEREREDA